MRKRDWKAGIRRKAREAGQAAVDAYLDLKVSRALKKLRLMDAYRNVRPMAILAFGIQSPKRGDSLATIFDKFKSDKHKLTCVSRGVGSFGKIENSNLLLADQELAKYDYVIMTDDDIVVPENFIDDLIAISEISGLNIAGPAQRRRSFHNHDITRREGKGLLRVTNYVEVGPMVLFRSDTFAAVFPLPVTKYGWGVDLLWSKLAARNRWKMGIVDGTPIRHLSPAGSTYDWNAAYTEMEEFRQSNDVALSVDTLAVIEHGLRF